MKKLFIFFYSAFLIFNSAFSFGQQAPGIEWQNTIGGSREDQLFFTQQTTDGGYILGGFSESDISGDKTENNWDTVWHTSDYWIIKTDISGNIQWQNDIGGIGIDNLTVAKQTSDGGYIVGGYSQSNISGDKSENSFGSSLCSDYWVIKLDYAGNMQWQNTIGGNAFDELYSLQQTNDGGFILGGKSNSDISGDKTENNVGGIGFYDYWIVKLNSTGNIQWQNTIGGSNDDVLSSVQQATDGGYILGGYSASNISGDKTENGLGYFDYWIVKTDVTGNIQWQNTIGGTLDDRLYSVLQTSDGGYILGGSSQSNISGDKNENNWDTTLYSYDYWIIKTDSSGNIQWQNTIGGANWDQLQCMQQTPDGGYIVGGCSASDSSGDKSENGFGNFDYWPVKINSTGNILWQKTIGGNNDDRLYSVQQTIDNGYILGGYSNSYISGNKTENSMGDKDYWIVKLDTDTITGVSDVRFDNFKIEVFPNPAKDEITIAGYALQNNQPAVLKIYDVMGKEVLSQSIVNHTSQIVNLKSFTSGVYFVQLQTGAKVSRMKFVKQ